MKKEKNNLFLTFMSEFNYDAHMSMSGKLFTGIRTIYQCYTIKEKDTPPPTASSSLRGMRPHEFLSCSGWMLTGCLVQVSCGNRRWYELMSTVAVAQPQDFTAHLSISSFYILSASLPRYPLNLGGDEINAPFVGDHFIFIYCWRFDHL